MTQPHPVLEHLSRLTQTVAAETADTARSVQAFGTVVRCIDGRCGVPAYGRLPYHMHGLLGAHLGERNAVRVRQLAEETGRRAARRGRPHVLVCETHTDCAYRARVQMEEVAVWEQFQQHTRGLLNTHIVWVSRDVTTGAITVHGTKGSVAATELAAQVTEAEVTARLALAGFLEPMVRRDLAWCLLANARFRQQPYAFAQHQEEGVVIGSGVPGDAGHFSISDRGEDLSLAVGVATSLLRGRGVTKPFLVLSLAASGTAEHQPPGLRRTQARQQRSVAQALAATGVQEYYRSFAVTVNAASGVLEGSPIALPA